MYFKNEDFYIGITSKPNLYKALQPWSMIRPIEVEETYWDINFYIFASLKDNLSYLMLNTLCSYLAKIILRFIQL